MSGVISILLDMVTIMASVSFIILIVIAMGWVLWTVISSIKDEIEYWKWERDEESEDKGNG